MPSKKAEGLAQQNNATADQGASQAQGRGTAAWNAAFPELMSQATNPQGYTPTQLAGINTANQQSAGGALSGVTGQAGLISGRTRNPGSMAAALGQATRGAGMAEAQRALGIQESNANLAQQKQQKALGELGGLYGTNLKGMSDLLSNANQATETELSAEKAPWQTGIQIADEVNKAGQTAATMM